MTDQPTGIGPITPIDCPEPGCYWACHGVPDKYADSRAQILAVHVGAEHGEQLPAAPVVAPTAPPAADLRDRIVRALAADDGWEWPTGFDITQIEDHPIYQRQADAVLAVLPAPTDQAAACPECGNAGACNGGPCPLADRRARYAAAIREESSRVDDIAIADAVIPVADAEQAELRDEVERLRTDRATTLREAADEYAKLADQNEAYDREHGNLDEAAQLTHDTVRDVAIGLRRMADEARRTEPAPALTEEHGHVWVTALDGNNRPMRDEHGRPVTHCGMCEQHPATAATEEPPR